MATGGARAGIVHAGLVLVLGTAACVRHRPAAPVVPRPAQAPSPEAQLRARATFERGVPVGSAGAAAMRRLGPKAHPAFRYEGGALEVLGGCEPSGAYDERAHRPRIEEGAVFASVATFGEAKSPFVAARGACARATHIASSIERGARGDAAVACLRGDPGACEVPLRVDLLPFDRSTAAIPVPPAIDLGTKEVPLRPVPRAPPEDDPKIPERAWRAALPEAARPLLRRAFEARAKRAAALLAAARGHVSGKGKGTNASDAPDEKARLAFRAEMRAIDAALVPIAAAAPTGELLAFQADVARALGEGETARAIELSARAAESVENLAVARLVLWRNGRELASAKARQDSLDRFLELPTITPEEKTAATLLLAQTIVERGLPEEGDPGRVESLLAGVHEPAKSPEERVVLRLRLAVVAATDRCDEAEAVFKSLEDDASPGDAGALAACLDRRARPMSTRPAMAGAEDTRPHGIGGVRASRALARLDVAAAFPHLVATAGGASADAHQAAESLLGLSTALGATDEVKVYRDRIADLGEHSAWARGLAGATPPITPLDLARALEKPPPIELAASPRVRLDAAVGSAIETCARAPATFEITRAAGRASSWTVAGDDLPGSRCVEDLLRTWDPGVEEGLHVVAKAVPGG